MQLPSVVEGIGVVRTACSNSSRTLSGADVVVQDGGTLAAAAYGWLAVWEHSPLI